MSGELTEAIQELRAYSPEEGWKEFWGHVWTLWEALPIWLQFLVALLILLSFTFKRLAPGIAMIIRARKGESP